MKLPRPIARFLIGGPVALAVLTVMSMLPLLLHGHGGEVFKADRVMLITDARVATAAGEVKQ